MHRGRVGGDHLTLETGAGIVKIDIDGDLITMTQVAPVFGPEVPKEIVAA